MQILPAVDVLDGAVVRLARGDYERVTVYDDDPVATATRFQEQGAALVHVVDLAGARDGSHDVDLWKRLGERGIRFQVGGGIRDAGRAVAAVAAGAVRVVVGTTAVWAPAVLGEMLTAVGSDRVVAALDVKTGRAHGAGWRDEGRPVADVAAELQDVGVVRALVTGISRDGMLSGPDVEVLEAVARAAPGLALIASGGVGRLADLELLRSRDVEGAIVGRAIYEGRFTVRQAVAVSSGPLEGDATET